jgi:hypothetical protein
MIQPRLEPFHRVAIKAHGIVAGRTWIIGNAREVPFALPDCPHFVVIHGYDGRISGNRQWCGRHSVGNQFGISFGVMPATGGLRSRTNRQSENQANGSGSHMQMMHL